MMYGLKTKKVIELLKNGPKKYSDVEKIVGSSQIEELVKRSVLIKFKDENPDYGKGLSGQRVYCQFLKIGVVEHTDIGNVGIEKAIKLLERNGYQVIKKPE